MSFLRCSVATLAVLLAQPALAGSPGKCQGSKAERKQKIEPRSMSEASFQQLVAAYEAARRDDAAAAGAAMLARLEAKHARHVETGAPFTFDILVLSGGGPKGAFGAGFLESWGTIPDGPHARPQFDVVTGVSTGALIAPFAFVGTDEAHATISSFYANPDPKWAKKRGLLAFLPSHNSLFNTCRLRDDIREAVTPALIESLAAGSRDNRVLLVGTTNLDTSSGRAFDLGRVAQSPSAQEDIVAILAASSAIPAAFAPVMIDGLMYADGGATTNLFIITFPDKSGPLEQFKTRHPGRPLPRVRLWILVNQKLRPVQDVTAPRWPDVSRQALDSLTSMSQVLTLNLIHDMTERARREHGLEVELRVASIPQETAEQASKAIFDRAYMNELLALGRAMGSDPSSWQTTVPSVHGRDDKTVD